MVTKVVLQENIEIFLHHDFMFNSMLLTDSLYLFVQISSNLKKVKIVSTYFC